MKTKILTKESNATEKEQKNSKKFFTFSLEEFSDRHRCTNLSNISRIATTKKKKLLFVTLILKRHIFFPFLSLDSSMFNKYQVFGIYLKMMIIIIIIIIKK